MANHQTGSRFFEMPHATVFVLVAVNILIYGLCLLYSGSEGIPTDVLFRAGAMYSAAIARHEYWRLGAYGFLHANLLHLATNMFCLALWGAHLERRVGSLYFMIIYLSALFFGAVVSNATHSGPFIAVGASGAISGVLGALFCLWILAKVDLTVSFFVVNIGLNVALALNNSSIDWGAHFGGFVAGMIACALLDLVERVNAHIFRCKFPEFVKVNSFAILVGLALLIFEAKSMPTMSAPETWLPVLVYVLAGLAFVKFVDILLSMKKGLASAAILFAGANGVLAFLWFGVVASFCTSLSAPGPTTIGHLIDMACANALLARIAIAMCVSVWTVVVYLPPLQRGLGDVGFVGASFRAERKRQQGI